MIILDSSPYTFTYDINASYEENFSLWSALNTEEKLAFNEIPYTLEEQKKIFSEMYSEKAWLRSIFCYTICIG